MNSLLRAAGNKSIANSSAGRWSNRQQIFIWLWLRLEVCYLAFSFTLRQNSYNLASVVRAGGFSIPPPSAILFRCLLCFDNTIMTQTNKIHNLKEYFEVVRQRPGMYLGTNTISKLHDHLQGYKMAYWHNDFDNLIDKNFFDNFNDFVYSYYGVTTNDNWRGVILEQCFNNEQAALTTFLSFTTFLPITQKRQTRRRLFYYFLTNLSFSSKT